MFLDIKRRNIRQKLSFYFFVKYLGLLLFFPGIVGRSSAQIKTRNGKQISIEAMDRFVKEQIDSLKLPALSIAIINDGKISYHRTLGVSNLNSQQKVNDQSIFEAASLSKPVFAYLAMKMVEKGKLNLDKPLYQYLPFDEISYDERYKLITARMVLSHTTGFPNWRWYDRADSALNIKDDDMYIKYPPGTFSYSGEGYHYLAKVVAHINGLTLKNLDSLFQKEVAIPLNMKHSYYSWNEYIGHHKPTGYREGKLFDKPWPAASPYEDSTLFGAGSTLHTNVVSYANFLIALMKDKGLKKQTLNEMLKQQSKIPVAEAAMWGEIAGWSLGFAVEPTDQGIRYSHGGDNGGFQAGCMFYKDTGYGYVFFTNCDQGGMFYVKLRTFLGEIKAIDK